MKNFLGAIILLTLMITACGARDVPRDISWVPSGETKNSLKNATEKEATSTEEPDSKSYEVFEYSQIADELIDKSRNDAASMVWSNQCMSVSINP